MINSSLSLIRDKTFLHPYLNASDKSSVINAGRIHYQNFINTIWLLHGFTWENVNQKVNGCACNIYQKYFKAIISLLSSHSYSPKLMCKPEERSIQFKRIHVGQCMLWTIFCPLNLDFWIVFQSIMSRVVCVQPDRENLQNFSFYQFSFNRLEMNIHEKVLQRNFVHTLLLNSKEINVIEPTCVRWSVTSLLSHSLRSNHGGYFPTVIFQ